MSETGFKPAPIAYGFAPGKLLGMKRLGDPMGKGTQLVYIRSTKWTAPPLLMLKGINCTPSCCQDWTLFFMPLSHHVTRGQQRVVRTIQLEPRRQVEHQVKQSRMIHVGLKAKHTVHDASKNKLDTLANTICVGTNWQLICMMGQVWNVRGFHNNLRPSITYMWHKQSWPTKMS